MNLSKTSQYPIYVTYYFAKLTKGKQVIASFSMDELSWDDRLNRCYYLAVSAMLDKALIEHVLIESLNQFKNEGEEYPFVKPAELKPGGIAPTYEYALHNTALVLLLEDKFPDNLKTFIRVRRKNALTSKNLSYFTFAEDQSIEGISIFREIISQQTMEAMKPLLELDMALVAQRQVKKGQFGIKFSNFHVRINGVLDSIIQDFGIDLKYLSKSLFEQGEDYSELLETKFYETFGMKTNASGRRTAAIVGHRLLKSHIDSLHTVYCGSTEARCLYKIYDNGTISRMVLIQLNKHDVEELSATFNLTIPELDAHYLISINKEHRAAVFLVTSSKQPAALPPEDKKLRRKISAMERWISIDTQCILPLPTSTGRKPLHWNWIYRNTGRTSETSSD